MVKGVNKTVIEVNNTDNKYFEKIVFYVTPEYGNLSAKQLRSAAEKFCYNFESEIKCKAPVTLRKRVQKKKRIRLGLLLVAFAVVMGVVSAVVFL